MAPFRKHANKLMSRYYKEFVAQSSTCDLDVIAFDGTVRVHGLIVEEYTNYYDEFHTLEDDMVGLYVGDYSIKVVQLMMKYFYTGRAPGPELYDINELHQLRNLATFLKCPEFIKSMEFHAVPKHERNAIRAQNRMDKALQPQNVNQSKRPLDNIENYDNSKPSSSTSKANISETFNTTKRIRRNELITPFLNHAKVLLDVACRTPATNKATITSSSCPNVSTDVTSNHEGYRWKPAVSNSTNNDFCIYATPVKTRHSHSQPMPSTSTLPFLTPTSTPTVCVEENHLIRDGMDNISRKKLDFSSQEPPNDLTPCEATILARNALVIIDQMENEWISAEYSEHVWADE